MNDKKQILLNLEHKAEHVTTFQEEEKQPFSYNNDKMDILELQTKLAYYDGPNPFERRLHFGCYEKLKIVLFFPISIIKLIAVHIVLIDLALLGILLKYLLCCWICNCSKSCCGKILRYYFRFLARLRLLFVYNIFWIRTKGKKPKKWPRVIVANHVSLFDADICYYLTGASFVAHNIVDQGGCFMRCIYNEIGLYFVNPTSKASRKETINKIIDHINNERLPPIFIFPEGLVHNTNTLTKFKVGAFKAGHAVLPLYIDYTNWFADCQLPVPASSCYGGGSFHLMSQFINFVTVTWMDVYHPNQNEQSNPMIYAENVRNSMADKFNAMHDEKRKVYVTPHIVDDIFLRIAMKRNGLKNCTFSMNDVKNKLKIDTSSMNDLCQIYMKYCDSIGDQTVDFDRFCDIFHISNKQIGMNIFKLLSGNKEYITFGDFLCGLSICYQTNLIDDGIVLFYVIMLFGNNNEGISSENCKHILKLIEKDVSKQFDHDMDAFCFKVFGSDSNTSFGFTEFKQSVKIQLEMNFIQLFLQFITYSFLETRLNVCLKIV